MTGACSISQHRKRRAAGHRQPAGRRHDHRRSSISASAFPCWARCRGMPVDAPIGGFAARDEAHWLTRYTGGWPLLFPNGGDACTVDGVFHGFHGEASISPWEATVSRQSARAHAPVLHGAGRDASRAHASMSDMLIVRERLRMHGTASDRRDVGPSSDLRLRSSRRAISRSRRVREARDRRRGLRPAAGIRFCPAPSALGRYSRARRDRSISAGRRSRLQRWPISHDFEAPWAAIRRLDNAVAVALSWTRERFPFAWLWYELSGTAEAPWHGRARVIGIEPSTTRPAYGLAVARQKGSPLLRLEPGDELTAELRLQVFRPIGGIARLDESGRACA